MVINFSRRYLSQNWHRMPNCTICCSSFDCRAQLEFSLISLQKREGNSIQLFLEMNDTYDDVEWLQNTRAADSGCNISETRIENDSRVLIRARHQGASVPTPEVNDIVVKAETWNPPFQEVILITSAFTREAVRWIENHNANTGNLQTLNWNLPGI